jgi:hypothetical protein
MFLPVPVAPVAGQNALITPLSTGEQQKQVNHDLVFPQLAVVDPQRSQKSARSTHLPPLGDPLHMRPSRF